MTKMINRLKALDYPIDSQLDWDCRVDFSDLQFYLETSSGNQRISLRHLARSNPDDLTVHFVGYCCFKVRAVIGKYTMLRCLNDASIFVVCHIQGMEVNDAITHIKSKLGNDAYNRCLPFIKGFLIHCIEWELDNFSLEDVKYLELALASVKKGKSKYHSAYDRSSGKGAFTLDEESRVAHWIYNRPNDINLKLLVGIRILFETGCRLEELRHIQHKDVRDDKNNPFINMLISKQKSGEKNIFRKRAISPSTLEKIKDLERCKIEMGMKVDGESFILCKMRHWLLPGHGSSGNEKGRISNDEIGSKTSITFFNQAFQKGSNWKYAFDNLHISGNKINISGLRFRHNFVARMVEQGKSSEAISHHLGQRSKDIIQAYIDVGKRGGRLIISHLEGPNSVVGRCMKVMNGEMSPDEIFSLDGEISGGKLIPSELYGYGGSEFPVVMGNCSANFSGCRRPEIDCLTCIEFKPRRNANFESIAESLREFVESLLKVNVSDVELVPAREAYDSASTIANLQRSIK